MNVTNVNFREVYPTIKHKIATCVFAAFDEEMTGISSQNENTYQLRDDTPDIRYRKMVPIATQYSIIQFGLCLFHVSDDGGLIASPYTFYLFRSNGPDLVMSPPAINFLRKNNMDFGLWVNNGITFLDRKGEDYVREKYALKSNQSFVEQKRIVLTKQSDKDFLERNMNLIRNMLLESSPDKVVLEDTNSFLRRVMYEQVEERFTGQVYLKKDPATCKLWAIHIKENQKAENDAKKIAECEAAIFDSLGFRNVFLDLVQSKVPVVGHNCLFDLLFMQRWLDKPLPPDIYQFRNDLYENIPIVYDTKYIATSGILGSVLADSTLESCYSHFLGTKTAQNVILPELVAIRCDEGFSELSDSTAAAAQAHDAGYDAYMTGCVFAQQFNIFRCANNASAPNDDASTLSFCDSLKVLGNRMGANKSFMARSIYHIDLTPSTEPGILKYSGLLLRVSGPKAPLQTSDIANVLDNVSGVDSSLIDVLRVNSSSFLLNIPLQYAETYSTFVSWPADWAVETFKHYKEMAATAENLSVMGNPSDRSITRDPHRANQELTPSYAFAEDRRLHDSDIVDTDGNTDDSINSFDNAMRTTNISTIDALRIVMWAPVRWIADKWNSLLTRTVGESVSFLTKRKRSNSITLLESQETEGSAKAVGNKRSRMNVDSTTYST